MRLSGEWGEQWTSDRTPFKGLGPPGEWRRARGFGYYLKGLRLSGGWGGQKVSARHSSRGSSRVGMLQIGLPTKV